MNRILKISLIFIFILTTIFLLRDYLLISAIKIFYEKEYQGKKLPFPQISEASQSELSDYIQNKFKTPEKYIVSKFETHDIIFIGESHRIKHDVELIQSLIPILYENDIYNLGMEFACHKDQALIDSLIFSKEYDQELANKILFESNILWGYQEYADIFRSANKLNKSISEGMKQFRIFGLNNPQHIGNNDDAMTKVIIKEFLDRDEKALIYCGIHHAITAYQQPQLENGKFIRFSDQRVGNRIYKIIGNRAFTICLHYPWAGTSGYSNDYSYPVEGVIDTLMKSVLSKYRSVGFDTKGSPFGTLACKGCIYEHGYKNLTLKDFCDGYIYQKPLSEYESVTTISDFINKNNIDEARPRFPNNSFKFFFDNFGTVFWNYAISMDADLKHMYQFSKYK